MNDAFVYIFKFIYIKISLQEKKGYTSYWIFFPLRFYQVITKGLKGI